MINSVYLMVQFMSEFDKNLISILEKIYAIEYICKDGIIQALKDIYGKREAIFSLLGAIHNELIDKIAKKDKSNEIIEKFDTMDIKGLKGIRNFIAHDYEGVNLAIIEDTIRFDISKMKQVIKTNFPHIVPFAKEKFEQNIKLKLSSKKS